MSEKEGDLGKGMKTRKEKFPEDLPEDFWRMMRILYPPMVPYDPTEGRKVIDGATLRKKGKVGSGVGESMVEGNQNQALREWVESLP